MKKNELFRHLQELTDEELFYQQYHRAKQSPEQLWAFLRSLDIEYLSRRKYVLPELKEKLNLHFADENWVWEDPSKDIYMHKHPRYMPEWVFVHEFYELIFAYYGAFDLHISHNIIPMKPGFVCILPPGVGHHVSIFDDSIALNIKVRKSTFHTSFSPLLTGNGILSQFFLNTMYMGNYKDYILFRNNDDAQLKELFSAIYIEHYNREKYSTKIMNNLLSMALSYLMRHYEESLETAMSGRNQSKKIEAILGYIEANFRKVSLGELAKEFFFTEQYLSKYIKENTGKTFKEIVRQIRLENARGLLETSNLTIGKVSEASGYGSTEHFMRQFKAKYGTSPAAYRKAYRM